MPLIHKQLDIAYFTPTKCGTVTAIRVLESCGFEFTTGDRHTMDPSLASHRYMQVRQPVERWCSIYWAICRWTDSGQHPFMHQWAHQPVQFADEFFRRRREQPWPIYTDNLLECYTRCQGQGFFKMEEVAQGKLATWAHELTNAVYGCGEPITPHLNKTKGRPSVQETLDLLRRDQVQMILEWAAPDLEFFGYDHVGELGAQPSSTG